MVTFLKRHEPSTIDRHLFANFAQLSKRDTQAKQGVSEAVIDRSQPLMHNVAHDDGGSAHSAASSSAISLSAEPMS